MVSDNTKYYWREIGESDWEECSESWYNYCSNSVIHDSYKEEGKGLNGFKGE